MTIEKQYGHIVYFCHWVSPFLFFFVILTILIYKCLIITFFYWLLGKKKFVSVNLCVWINILNTFLPRNNIECIPLLYMCIVLCSGINAGRRDRLPTRREWRRLREVDCSLLGDEWRTESTSGVRPDVFDMIVVFACKSTFFKYRITVIVFDSVSESSWRPSSDTSRNDGRSTQQIVACFFRFQRFLPFPFRTRLVCVNSAMRVESDPVGDGGETGFGHHQCLFFFLTLSSDKRLVPIGGPGRRLNRHRKRTKKKK